MGRSIAQPVRALLASLALITSSAPAQAPADVRVALVIGNAAYPGPMALRNPANDAAAVARTLKELGFRVVEARDATRAQMLAAISQLAAAVKNRQGIGLLYYAGHGVQFDWRNYMFPVDARPRQASELKEQAVDVNGVLDALQAAGVRMSIVILDACRDNPFVAAGAKGLAPMDAASGTFVAYATAPGNVADDGEGDNGLYTKHLLAEIRKPASIENVFKRVRLRVRQESGGRQVPWESTSLEEDFQFSGGVAAPVSAREQDRRFEAEKADWDAVKEARDPAPVFDFLQKHPGGFISEVAQAKLDTLAQVTVQVQQDPGIQAASSGAVRRFRDGDWVEFVHKDGLTGLERGRSTITTKELGDGRWETKASGFSNATSRGLQAGFILQDGNDHYDPPMANLPYVLQVGRKWTSRSVVTRGARSFVMELKGQVVAREQITVPAGTFMTYRVETLRQYEGGDVVTTKGWFEPDFGAPVRWQRELRGRMGGPPEITVRELAARRRTG